MAMDTCDVMACDNFKRFVLLTIDSKDIRHFFVLKTSNKKDILVEEISQAKSFSSIFGRGCSRLICNRVASSLNLQKCALQ